MKLNTLMEASKAEGKAETAFEMFKRGFDFKLMPAEQRDYFVRFTLVQHCRTK